MSDTPHDTEADQDKDDCSATSDMAVDSGAESVYELPDHEDLICTLDVTEYNYDPFSRHYDGHDY